MRQKIGEIAGDVAAHFQVIENIKSLQAAQKETAVALKEFGDRIRALEIEMKVLKAEVKYEEGDAVYRKRRAGQPQRAHRDPVHQSRGRGTVAFIALAA